MFKQSKNLFRFGAALIAAFVVIMVSVALASADSPKGEVEAIWEKARQAATYQFDTTARQTTHLVAHPANAGRRT